MVFFIFVAYNSNPKMYKPYILDSKQVVYSYRYLENYELGDYDLKCLRISVHKFECKNCY